MKCPVCDETLREILKQGVSVDICPGCKGVWLDRGELEKLIELSAYGGTRPDLGTAAHTQVAPYRKRDEHDDDHITGHDRDHDRGYERRDEHGHGLGGQRKKSSWLGDILGGLGGED